MGDYSDATWLLAHICFSLFFACVFGYIIWRQIQKMRGR